jgi:hypothetical protein
MPIQIRGELLNPREAAGNVLELQFHFSPFLTVLQ